MSVLRAISVVAKCWYRSIDYQCKSATKLPGIQKILLRGFLEAYLKQTGHHKAKPAIETFPNEVLKDNNSDSSEEILNCSNDSDKSSSEKYLLLHIFLRMDWICGYWVLVVKESFVDWSDSPGKPFLFLE
jgi:hypothetical protein